MDWNIVTDSSCDLPPINENGGLVRVSSVPFVIRVGDKEFIDDGTLNPAAMLEAMERSGEASRTACPAPQSWIEQFEKADQSIAITISSRLSGSIGSATLAKDMVLERYPNKKIAVLDSLSTGPEIAICAEKVRELIQANWRFERIVAEAESLLKRTHTAFALSSFDNLVKNGRMSKIAGFIAQKLGMWGIGVASEIGTIAIKGKTRGSIKAISMLLDDMKEHGFRGGKVAISHCQNLALAEKLQSRIHEFWVDCDVRILPTRGLCSYYAERGGIILSYS